MKPGNAMAVLNAARLYRAWAIESKVQVMEENGRRVHDSLLAAVEAVDGKSSEPLALHMSHLCFILDSIEVDELAMIVAMNTINGGKEKYRPNALMAKLILQFLIQYRALRKHLGGKP